MAGLLKMIAKDIFMCGLRQVPILCQAAEVVESVQNRYEALRQQERLEKVERELTGFDRKLRDLVQTEIQVTIAGLSRRDLDVVAFSGHIQNLLDIKQNGWSPALFQG